MTNDTLLPPAGQADLQGLTIDLSELTHPRAEAAENPTQGTPAVAGPTRPQGPPIDLSKLTIPPASARENIKDEMQLASGGPTGPRGPRIDLSDLACIPLDELGVPTSYPTSIQSDRHNRLCRLLQEDLSAALNLLAERAIQCTAPLTHRIRSGDPLASEQLSEIHDHLRQSYFVSQRLMTEIESLTPWHDSIVDLDYNPLPQSSQGFQSAWATMARWHPELQKKPTSPLVHADSGLAALESSPWLLVPHSARQYRSLPEASGQNIKAAFRELWKSESFIEGLAIQLQSEPLASSPLKISRLDFLFHDMANEISRTIMLHHREPGDPAIREYGGVIADVSPQLVSRDIRDGCQAILCHRQGQLVGLAFFLPPGKLTEDFSDLDAHYPNTRNAGLVQVLVAPSALGSGVFETVMNATLLTLQSTGADKVLGEVEHTNDRAKRSYEKFSGQIDDTFSTESISPSGKPTQWNALNIPMPGNQRDPERLHRIVR